MCRVLSDLGRPLLLDDLLYQPDNSLVRQSYDPQMLHMLNLAGFGMAISGSQLAPAGATALVQDSRVAGLRR